MKLLINSFIILFQNHRIIFSAVFISLLSFFSIFSITNFLNDKIYLLFISIFILIFIVNFWLILLTFPRVDNRVNILSIISIRNKILKKTNLIGAEIGVYRGLYTEKILKYFKKQKLNLKMELIDPWVIDGNYKEYGSQNLELAYQEVKKKFENNKNITIMKTDSLNASQKFSDNYFDFVYIDGNHDYDFVLQDLKLWFPKVKNKGILFGDDYNRPYGVSKAVAEFSYENKLTVHLSDNGSQYFLIKE